jgi:hypothetical protein
MGLHPNLRRLSNANSNLSLIFLGLFDKFLDSLLIVS